MKNNVIDDNCIYKWNNRNSDAFCKLYAYYKDRVIYYAAQLLKSRDLAQDVYQEAFISIWQDCPQFENQKAFSGYLYKIIRNRIFNMYRESAKEQSVKESILSHAIDVSNDTEEFLEDKELSSLLEEILQKLPTRNRTIFRMSREEMLSYKEIAEKLDLSVASVQRYMSDSLGIIREYLAEYAGICPTLVLSLLWLFDC